MTCFELVDKMLADGARVRPERYYGKFKVTLLEPGSADSAATIFDLPEDAIVIRLDESIDLARIFRGAYGECKRADFIIVAERGDSVVIVYIEMKRSSDKRVEIVRQLQGARCFVHYMQTLGKAFAKHRTFLDSAKHRFVSIKHTGRRKRRTETARTGAVHDSPESALAISWPHHVEFAQLAGGN
jgi:hypothetical protein